MFIVHRLKPGQSSRPFTTEACGIVVAFQQQRHEGEIAMVAEIPDTHPAAGELARKFSRMPAHDVIHDDGQPVVETPPPVPVPLSAPTPFASLPASGPGKPRVSLHLDDPRVAQIARRIREEAEAIARSPENQSFVRSAVERLLVELGFRQPSDAVEVEGPPTAIRVETPEGPFGTIHKTDADPRLMAAIEVTDAALGHGWSREDLEGSGEFDDPGPEGGYSHRTGLCLAQMALSTPPPGWAEQAATHYPWELEGFRAPALDWTPPVGPTKRPPAPPVAEETSPPAAGLSAAPPSDLEGQDFDEEDDDEDGMSAYDQRLAAETEAAAKATGSETTGSGDPAVAAGYPADQVDAARRVAHKLLSELSASGADTLSHSKFNWAVRKMAERDEAHLHTVTEVQLAGLLAVAPTT